MTGGVHGSGGTDARGPTRARPWGGEQSRRHRDHPHDRAPECGTAAPRTSRPPWAAGPDPARRARAAGCAGRSPARASAPRARAGLDPPRTPERPGLARVRVRRARTAVRGAVATEGARVRSDLPGHPRHGVVRPTRFRTPTAVGSHPGERDRRDRCGPDGGGPGSVTTADPLAPRHRPRARPRPRDLDGARARGGFAAQGADEGGGRDRDGVGAVGVAGGVGVPGPVPAARRPAARTAAHVPTARGTHGDRRLLVPRGRRGGRGGRPGGSTKTRRCWAAPPPPTPTGRRSSARTSCVPSPRSAPSSG